MPDYSKGKIYTIRCRTDATLIYVGSTIPPLAKRWEGHKCLTNPKYILYQTMNNDWDNWYIELYELFPCNLKEELTKQEGELIRLIGNLNYRIEGRTKQEWSIKYNQEYRKNNINKLKEYQNEKHTCLCGGCYTTTGKSKHLKTKKHIKYLEQPPSPSAV